MLLLMTCPRSQINVVKVLSSLKTISFLGKQFAPCYSILSSKHNLSTFTNCLASKPHRKFLAKPLNICSISGIYHNEEQGIRTDLKVDAEEIFKYGVQSVHPKQMIENVLEYDEKSGILKVHGRRYDLHNNVYVVGFGKAVLGMARVVENILGNHIQAGIVSIPKGLPKQLEETKNYNVMLKPNTKIEMFEGAADNRVDETGYQAAQAIQKLVSNLTDDDVLIVLCSGGGSVLLPYPQPPISLEDLKETVHVLSHHPGCSIKEINTVRKNIEVLKGGRLAIEAKPAKVIALILSSILGRDPVDLVAGGPTHPTQHSPQQCLEIFRRLRVIDQIPASVVKYLEKECSLHNLYGSNTKNTITYRAMFDELWSRVRNVVVGNNSIACEAAADKATELGYLPLVLTKSLTGEAKKVGEQYAKLAKFIMLCLDGHISTGPNQDLAVLELELVVGGISKKWINSVVKLANEAHNMNKDVCIISGGDTFVQLDGKGVGGKNMETALAAAVEMKRLCEDEMFYSETNMCFLSADSDGYDGTTDMSGAVIDQNFIKRVEELNLDMKTYLNENNSFNLFSKANGGKNLISTYLTGTNVMDILILLVKRPPI